MQFSGIVLAQHAQGSLALEERKEHRDLVRYGL